MSPAATKPSAPAILLLANSDGEVKELSSKTKTEPKKASPKRRASKKASTKELNDAANELLAAADKSKESPSKTGASKSARSW